MGGDYEDGGHKGGVLDKMILGHYVVFSVNTVLWGEKSYKEN